MRKIEHPIIIEMNAKFIFDNSGLILTKLENPYFFKSTFTSLKKLIFVSDNSVCKILKEDSNLKNEYKNSIKTYFEIIIKIYRIFYNGDLPLKEKEKIKNILVLYINIFKNKAFQNDTYYSDLFDFENNFIEIKNNLENNQNVDKGKILYFDRKQKKVK